MLTACLLVFNLFMPIVVAAHTNSMWLAVVIAFMSTMAYQGLNEVARELEDPFKPTHLNDLGLPLLQAEFNSKLRAASPPVGLSTPWLEE
jgi:predicted membrane chloride channel (bestrophin family)